MRQLTENEQRIVEKIVQLKQSARLDWNQRKHCSFILVKMNQQQT